MVSLGDLKPLDRPPMARRTTAAPHPTRSFLFLKIRMAYFAYDEKIKDRQVGRNAQLFARAIADLETPEERYPYLRILVSIIEQAHPEWNQAPKKDRQIAHLVGTLSDGALDQDEVAEVVRVRDGERGHFYD